MCPYYSRVNWSTKALRVTPSGVSQLKGAVQVAVTGFGVKRTGHFANTATSLTVPPTSLGEDGFREEKEGEKSSERRHLSKYCRSFRDRAEYNPIWAPARTGSGGSRP